MSKLTFEISLCMAIALFAFMYLREKYRNLRSRTSEWLRLQRIKAAATIVGPAAVPALKKRADPRVKNNAVSSSQVVYTPSQPSIVTSEVFANIDFDEPTYLRKFGRLRVEKPVEQIQPTSRETVQPLDPMLIFDDELFPTP